MIARLALVFLLTSPIAFAQFNGSLVFLNNAVVSELKNDLPPPPTKGSKEQRQDEEQLMPMVKSRTKADCARAATEIEATLNNLYGPPYGPLSKAEVDHLDGFFKVVKNEVSGVIHDAKSKYSRQRPYQYLKGIDTCIKPEKSNSYPSGHGTYAEVYALILADFFPSKKAALDTRDAVVGSDRVLAGLHHPSDIAAGHEMGRKIYEALKKSSAYQAAFKKLK